MHAAYWKIMVFSYSEKSVLYRGINIVDNNLNQANFSDYYTAGVVCVVTLGPFW